MEKLKPHYDLTDIKSAFADPSQLNRTFVATQGAQRLGLVSQQIVDVIQSLAHSDFDKSMTSHASHTIWQDVYKPNMGEVPLYVKFTLDETGAFLLISFKEA